MERFDLFDSDRRPTGELVTRGEKIPDGRYHIAIHVCIFDSSGRMLIQQRQTFKDGFPGMWDVSVGGSAIAGETSREAAIREVREELGIDIASELDARPVLSTVFFNGFNDFYTVKKEVGLDELTLQAEEVKAARWATYSEIVSMIEDGSFIPYRIPLIGLLFTLREGIEKNCPIELSIN